MNGIATSAHAITSAFARYDRASEKLTASFSGASNDNAAEALAEQIEAKAEVKANVGVVRMADEMFKALLDIARGA